MLEPYLQQFAMYSLPMTVQPEALPVQDRKNAAFVSREVDTLMLTTRAGESILVPSRGLTIQIGAIGHGCVELRIAVPSRTKVFRMGAFRRRREGHTQHAARAVKGQTESNS